VDAGERRGFGALRPLRRCDTREAFGEVSSPRWLPPLLWAALILILTSIPGSLIPASPFRNFDKIVHLTIYGVLGWLTVRAWADGSRTTAPTLVAIALVSCFGAFDEWHQEFIPQRSMDILDWAADTTGALMGAIAALTSDRGQVDA
jgi:hypothetical protein